MNRSLTQTLFYPIFSILLFCVCTGLHAQSDYSSAHAISTLAGGVSPVGGVDGTGATASFRNPEGVAVDSSGNVYVADAYNHKIRKITAAGVVSTLPSSGFPAGNSGSSGSLYRPSGVTVDGSGNIYIADTYNHLIRKITASGVLSNLAGSGYSGSDDNATIGGGRSSFNTPSGVAVDSNGNIYVADTANNKIRKVTAAGLVSTLAGSGSSGSTDGPGATASFNSPSGVSVDSTGNVYVADTNSCKIRKITVAGVREHCSRVRGSR